MKAFSVRYTLDGPGWAEAVVSDEHRSVRLTASYVHDSLADLASAALAVLKGAPKITVTFEDEPGELNLVYQALSEAGQTFVEVRLPGDWGRYTVVERFEVTRRAFAEATLEALEAVLDEHGV